MSLAGIPVLEHVVSRIGCCKTVGQALGTSQHKRLDEFISARNFLAERYAEKLSEVPVRIQTISDKAYSAYHLFVVNLQDENHVSARQTIFNYMRESGVGVNVHYIPVHTHPHYKSLGFKWGDFPISEGYYKSAITLPMFPDLTTENQDYVVEKLREAMHL